MRDLSINNVIINNGASEYHKNEILNDINLSRLLSRVLTLHGIASIIDKINQENATLYIMSDSEYSVRKIELLNASEELHKEFWNKTK